MSFGGHVGAGETYDKSFKREVEEELNINTDSIKWISKGKLTPNDGVSSFMKIYEIKLEEIKNYNKEDFIGYEWLHPAEVIAKIENGDKAKDDLPKIIKIFYLE